MEFIEKQDIFAGNMMLIDDKGNKITYGDFEDIYEKEEQLLESGTLAFLFCRNAVGSVLYYRICLRKHVVPLLLEHQMDEELLKALLETYEPEYLIGMLEDLKKAGSDGAVMDGSDCFGYRIKKREPKRRTKLHPDLALLLTTSGSTGSPKLVRQSRKNICANAESIAEYLNLDSSERPITTLPMNYTYGLSIMNSHFEVGAAVLLTEHTLFEREFWEFFREEKATSFGGVPYTYQILKRLNLFDMDLPSLKTMTQAGGKLPVSLHREFAEYAASTGKNFIVMYGQTEATARMSYLPAEDAIRKCGSMGIAIPGGRFRIMEDEKREITAPDTVGELVYEGANVTMGYAECAADLEKGDERGGILFTGDMAKRDEDGYYYITGRKKRFLKMYGKRVNMDEIEQILRGQYEGVEIACTGADDRMRIYMEGTSPAVCEEAAEFLTEKTGLYPGGIRILPIDKIPKNESGQTIYKELEKLPWNS